MKTFLIFFSFQFLLQFEDEIMYESELQRGNKSAGQAFSHQNLPLSTVLAAGIEAGLSRSRATH
jgi:hypothetical protein